MNFNRARSWPHPVMSLLSDDVMPNNFDFQLDVWPEHKRWLLGIEAENNDPTLCNLISRGEANYLLHVECKRTYYRQSFPSSKSLFEVPISGDMLFGNVEVSLLVIVASDLNAYNHPGQHGDYRGSVFTVSTGEPLAVAPSKSFEAFLEADPILKLSSILDIKRGDDGVRIMKVNSEGDRIVVTLPTGEFDRYRDLRADPAIRGLLATTVVLPALLDAFYYLRDPDIDLGDFKANHRWCRCVLGRLEQLGIDITNRHTESSVCLDAAQTLLREPLRRSLEDLSGLFTDAKP